MPAVASRTQILRHRSSAGGWELAIRSPAPTVRRYVRDYCGYVETTPGLLRRREFPAVQVVVIFDFGPPIRLLDPQDESRATRYGCGFVAGMDDSFSVTEHDGFSHGLQVNFTPIGARLFFGMPMADLARRIVGMDDLLGARDRGFPLRLQEAPGWDARFDLLDHFIAERIARARARTDIAAWALARIEGSGGLVDVRALARELGYSQKHLIAQFRDQVGLPPKLVARIARFDSVMRHLKSGGAGTWAQIAAEFGYYDQAHLNRDFRDFTGGTPTDARRSVAGIGAAIASEQVNSIQDLAG